MKTMSVTDEQFELVKTALEWYREDRRNCAASCSSSLLGAEEEERIHWNAGAEASNLLEELERQERVPVKLYIVEHYGNGRDNGDDWDVYIRATSESEAIAFWRGYYALHPNTLPDKVRIMPSVSGPIGAIPWSEL